MPSILETSLVLRDRVSPQVTRMRAELRATEVQAVATGRAIDRVGATATGRAYQSHTASAGKMADAHSGAADAMAATGAASKQVARDTEAAAASQEKSASRVNRALNSTGVTAGQVARKHEMAAAAASKSWSSSGSAMVKMGKAVVATFLATGVATVNLAMKYQESTRLFQTQAGVSAKDAKVLSQGILRMAGAMGQTPIELSKGMYHIVSSMNNLIPPVHRSAVELGILRDSAKLAAVGHSNLTQTTYVLSSAMNALGQKGLRGASQTMKELNAIVGTGDMHMEDLMGAMSTGFVSAAKTFGLSLHSAGAALAFMTDRGVPAQMAATRLRMSFSLLGAPTKAAAKDLRILGLSHTDIETRSKAMTEALKKSGVQTTDLAADLRKPDGIYVALKDLKDHMTAAGVNATTQAAIISRAFGGGRSGSTIMAMYNNIDVVRQKYNQQTKVANDFDKAWALRQKDLHFRLTQAKDAVIALGTRIGTALIPWVNKGLVVVKDMAHWFTKHETAAKALAFVLGTVMVAAVGALALNVAKKIGGATKEFYEFGKAVATAPARLARWGYGKATGAPAGAPGPGPGGAAAVGEGQIVGWDGMPTMAGSKGNPIAVLVVDPTGSPLSGPGGPAAPGRTLSMEEKAAAGTAPYDWSKASAAGEAAVAGEAAAAGTAEKGLLARIGGGAAGIGGKVLGGAGVAGLGLMATQLATPLISSTLGKGAGGYASAIGTGAALGGGVGSIIPGVGTLLGAGIGGGVGALLHATGAAKPEQQIGARYQADVKAGDATKLQADVALADRYAAALKAAGENTSKLTAMTAQARTAIHQLDLKNMGDMLRGIAGIRFPTVPMFIKDIDSHFKKMTTTGRQQGSDAMIEMAAAMEKDGRLPVGATNQLISQIEKKYPALKSFIIATGHGSMAGLQKEFRDQRTVSSVQDQVKMIRQNWGLLPGLAKTNGANIYQNWRAALAAVKSEMHTGSKASREAASHEYDLLLSYQDQVSQTMVDHWANQLSSMSGTTGNEYWNMMSTALSALKSIGLNTNQALKALGLNPVRWSWAAAVSGAAGGAAQQKAFAQANTAYGGSAAANKFIHATGGRLPGPARGDHIPLMSRGGGLLGIADGGELVVNKHSERKADSFLSAFGTRLSTLVANETKPHTAPAFATGGRTVTASEFGGPGDPGTGSTGYRGDNLYSKPDSYAELNMGTALGGLPYQAPLNVSFAGHTATLYKRDIGAGGPGIGGTSRAIDLWFQAAQKLGFSGLGLVQVASGSGFPLGAGGGMAAAPTIQAPKISGPPGPMTGIDNAVAKKGADAANKYIAKHMPQLSFGSAGGASTAGGPVGVGTYKGVPMANWVIESLNYAAGKGVAPQPTSGYRPGADPHTASGASEHAGTQYPHGAVDFGGYSDPTALAEKMAVVNATAGFKWPLLAPIGFHDDGHASGTGHQLGGRLGPSWGGWHAKGTDMVIHRPTVFGAGERGPERVQITPAASATHGGVHVAVHPGGIVVHGGGSQEKIRRAMERHLEEFVTQVEHELSEGAEENDLALIR